MQKKQITIRELYKHLRYLNMHTKIVLTVSLFVCLFIPFLILGNSHPWQSPWLLTVPAFGLVLYLYSKIWFLLIKKVHYKLILGWFIVLLLFSCGSYLRYRFQSTSSISKYKTFKEWTDEKKQHHSEQLPTEPVQALRN
jgi:hypothetical protein